MFAIGEVEIFKTEKPRPFKELITFALQNKRPDERIGKVKQRYTITQWKRETTTALGKDRKRRETISTATTDFVERQKTQDLIANKKIKIKTDRNQIRIGRTIRAKDVRAFKKEEMTKAHSHATEQ